MATHFRQSIAVEHDDLFEMGREGFRRCEACHSGANDDGLFQNRIDIVVSGRRDVGCENLWPTAEPSEQSAR
jgi:cytochrome c2